MVLFIHIYLDYTCLCPFITHAVTFKTYNYVNFESAQLMFDLPLLCCQMQQLLKTVIRKTVFMIMENTCTCIFIYSGANGYFAKNYIIGCIRICYEYFVMSMYMASTLILIIRIFDTNV